ncbi:hypothetical protein SAMN05421858_2342 [Haladaptatus litoreus]|uniref:DUF7991 domain-containing protein n=1 Tax=Haladaptatus litoreus TaxID=553468 RepID=A0A1N7B533_9EURY|nr:hypothetical protein [Haladaptatus litoreus]SIR46471.1 hypothetical protein SAMN05421858_2342 [Haladaptatus litoreus]
MVSAATALGFLVIIIINTVITAVVIRFFRLRLSTKWGAVVYSLLLVPLVYVATTLLLSGAVGLGGSGLQDTNTALILIWVLPFTLGLSIDLFWMPPPEEIDLPKESREQQQSR